LKPTALSRPASTKPRIGVDDHGDHFTDSGLSAGGMRLPMLLKVRVAP
jgi:hypothetical protein